MWQDLPFHPISSIWSWWYGPTTWSGGSWTKSFSRRLWWLLGRNQRWVWESNMAGLQRIISDCMFKVVFFNMFHADVSFLWVGWFTCITSGSSPLAWHPYINVSYSLQSALIRRIPVGSRGFFLLVLGLIASAKSSITDITVDLWWTRC